MKKFLLSTLIILLLSSAFALQQPKKAKADITKIITGPSCALYSATIGKIKDKAKRDAEERARKEVENKAKKEGEKQIKDKTEDKVGEVLGIALGTNPVPVEDSAARAKIAETAKQQREHVVELTCEESVRKFLLSMLKKHLLDYLVDGLVQYIQNGEAGKPRFLTDTKGFFNDAKNRAIGDVALEIAPFLCSPFRLDVQIGLAQPGSIIEQTRCTWDDIKGNFGDFFQSFETAGWLGYSEALKPQNNRWGAELLAQNEVFRRLSLDVQSASIEATMGSGFLSAYQCLKWSFVDLRNNRHVTSFEVSYPADTIYNVKDPFTDPAVNEALQKRLPPDGGYIRAETVAAEMLVANPNDLLGYAWKCDERKTTTPGRLIGDLATKGISSEFDYIINAEDLSEYIAVLADAAITRLTGEAISGLAGLYASDDSPPRGSASVQPLNCDIFKERLSDGTLSPTERSLVCEESIRTSRSMYSITKDNVLELLENASTTANELTIRFASTSQELSDIEFLLGEESGTEEPPQLLSCLKRANDLTALEEAKKVKEAVQTFLISDLNSFLTRLSALKTTLTNLKVTVDTSTTEDAVTIHLDTASTLESDLTTLENEALDLTELSATLKSQIVENLLSCRETLNPNTP